MEEEKVEVKKESKKPDVKGFDFKNFNYKKYLPYAGIALAVIVVIILLVVLLGGGPKKAVKGFINGMNKQSTSKLLKNIDFAGMSVWTYDEDDFSESDYEDFIEEYKDVDKDEIKEEKQYIEDNFEDSFDEMKDYYKSYKMKIDKFKEVKKLGKDLYAVDAKISLEAKPKDKDERDEIDRSNTVTFIVYKNKLISFGGINL